MRKPTASRIAEKKRKIKNQWDARPVEQRTAKHIDDFAEDMTRQGLNLDAVTNQHIEQIRYLLGVR